MTKDFFRVKKFLRLGKFLVLKIFYDLDFVGLKVLRVKIFRVKRFLRLKYLKFFRIRKSFRVLNRFELKVFSI